MKKYLFGLIASAFAIVAFSFTTKTGGIGTNCDEQLYYFKVRSTVLVECTQILTLSQITPVAETSIPTQPNEVIFAFATANPHGCPDVELACAVGYSRDQIELVNGFWQPKVVNGQLVDKKCCVRLAEQP